ncbi:MAG: terminase family protein [Planctomycetota bacterium]
MRKAATNRIRSDIKFFVKKLLGYQLTEFHAKWFLFQVQHKESLILAPRGHGKSTVCTVCYSIWSILQLPDIRILIVSNTAAQAESFLREIRTQLTQNDKLIAFFGSYLGPRWTQEEIIVSKRRKIAKEATITAMGVGGPIISKHYDMIILDDIVDEDNARTEEQRNKIKVWYYKSLLPCLEPDGEIHVLGTRYHPYDLYNTLMGNTG